MKPTIFKLLRSTIPFMTGLGMLAILTIIFYSGGKRENLAAYVETHLIERALIFAKHPAKQSGLVKTVTLQDNELPSFPRAPRDIIADAHLSVYADILDVVLSQSSGLVIVNWLHGAHFDDMQYLSPILKTIDKYQAQSRVLLTFPKIYFNGAPPELHRNYRVLEGNDCVYDVNIYCSLPDWENWTISVLANRLWKNRGTFSVSYNLPHVLPNIVANLPDPESIPDYGFTEVLSAKKSDLFKDTRMVAIGSNLTQGPLLKNSKDAMQKTYIATSSPRDNLMKDGLPLHRFWGGLSQMFLEDSTIAIPPAYVSYAFAAMVVIFIIFVMFKAGSGFALLVFMISTISYILLNCLAVKYLNLYVPIVSAIYSGLITVTLAVFVAIPQTLFRHFFVSTQQAGMSELVDLKQNFISLISHNLNTPIAKLKGLIDVLAMRPAFDSRKDTIRFCGRLITELQFLVRTVLLNTSLEQRSILLRTFSTEQLREELCEYLKPYAAAISTTYACEIEDNDSVIAYKTLDPKFFSHCVLAILWNPPFHGRDLTLKLCAVTEQKWRLVGTCDDSSAVQSLLSSFHQETAQQYMVDCATTFEFTILVNQDGKDFELFF